ncbi:protein phosphatase 1 regulatory subunit 7 [Pancytospora philotis]|nr:protein phosphatase 1 regulatory subunit 7 [Pancytospora philotis]
MCHMPPREKMLCTEYRHFLRKFLDHMQTGDDDLYLDYSNLKLTEVPDIDGGIRELSLRKNKIDQLSFAGQNSIENIDLSDNLIKDLAPLSALRRARIVDCSYNLVSSIPALDLPELSELYLIANDIERIENIRFPGLRKLDLASNSIRAIENIESAGIEELYLASNKIERVPSLAHYDSLKVLDLQYNRLTELDCSLLPASLEILLLQGNSSLTTVTNLAHLSNLKMVNTGNTRLGSLDFAPSVTQW